MLSARLVNDPGNFPHFKGMLIGNGCVDDRLMYNSLIDYNYDHTFIDENEYRRAVDFCCNDNSTYACDFYEMSQSNNSFYEMYQHDDGLYEMFQNNDSFCRNESLALNGANIATGLDPFFLYYTCRLDEPSRPSMSSVVLRTHLRKSGHEEVNSTVIRNF
ncbi:unnamed protein product [Strongylus vulgaris]|uniref:Uncharacterized protein n=1 Tax=Strongylus vulgaris TaxID=40348 RepID=A0A3P7M228_STRVU|nr:unnamed protein product [Strongylus vulgaris]